MLYPPNQMTTARTPVRAQREGDPDVFCSPLSGPEEGGEDELTKSVGNSRKRFLSPGVLRGELVADRLLEQEASASPFLKRTKTGSGMALSAAEFREFMAENVTKRFDKIESSVDSIETTVKAHSTKIDKHESLLLQGQQDIAALRRDVDRIQDERRSNWPPPLVLRPLTARSPHPQRDQPPMQQTQRRTGWPDEL